jgi:hypothetical protein
MGRWTAGLARGKWLIFTGNALTLACLVGLWWFAAGATGHFNRASGCRRILRRELSRWSSRMAGRSFRRSLWAGGSRF